MPTAHPSKTLVGIPEPQFPRGVVLAVEAARGRRRLYPPTVAYLAFAGLILAASVRQGHAVAATVYGAAGVLVWTYVEYLVHRYVLHGIFPPEGGAFARLLHARFDHLHVEHHRRPWDGNHINGTLMDTLPVVAPVAALAFLTPVYTWPAFLGGFMAAYVAEEWIHHSTHFYTFDNAYFRYLKARHLYHHSRAGAEIIFGLSNGIWDEVFDTRSPAAVRHQTPLRDSLGWVTLRRRRVSPARVAQTTVS